MLVLTLCKRAIHKHREHFFEHFKLPFSPCGTISRPPPSLKYPGGLWIALKNFGSIELNAPVLLFLFIFLIYTFHNFCTFIYHILFYGIFIIHYIFSGCVSAIFFLLLLRHSFNMKISLNDQYSFISITFQRGLKTNSVFFLFYLLYLLLFFFSCVPFRFNLSLARAHTPF